MQVCSELCRACMHGMQHHLSSPSWATWRRLCEQAHPFSSCAPRPSLDLCSRYGPWACCPVRCKLHAGLAKTLAACHIPTHACPSAFDPSYVGLPQRCRRFAAPVRKPELVFRCMRPCRCGSDGQHLSWWLTPSWSGRCDLWPNSTRCSAFGHQTSLACKLGIAFPYPLGPQE